MHIAILVIASLLIIFWLILLGRVTPEDWLLCAYVRVYDNYSIIKNCVSTKKSLLKNYPGIAV